MDALVGVDAVVINVSNLRVHGREELVAGCSAAIQEIAVLHDAVVGFRGNHGVGVVVVYVALVVQEIVYVRIADLSIQIQDTIANISACYEIL